MVGFPAGHFGFIFSLFGSLSLGCPLGQLHQLSYFFSQLRFQLLDLFPAQGTVLGGIGFHLRAIQTPLGLVSEIPSPGTAGKYQLRSRPDAFPETMPTPRRTTDQEYLNLSF